MPTPPFRRTAAVLLLVLTVIVAAPPAFAAGPRLETVSLSPVEVLDHLWSFLRIAWNKDGCNIDPDGQCQPGPASPPPAQAKDSCHIDPNGRCKPGPPSPPPVQTKTGCGIDPDGRCKP